MKRTTSTVYELTEAEVENLIKAHLKTDSYPLAKVHVTFNVTCVKHPGMHSGAWKFAGATIKIDQQIEDYEMIRGKLG